MRGEKLRLSRSRKNKNRKPTQHRKPAHLSQRQNQRLWGDLAGQAGTSRFAHVNKSLQGTKRDLGAGGCINQLRTTRKCLSQRRKERDMMTFKKGGQFWSWDAIKLNLEEEQVQQQDADKVILSYIISHMWNQIIVPLTSTVRSKVCSSANTFVKGRKKPALLNRKTTMWNSPFGPTMEQWCGWHLVQCEVLRGRLNLKRRPMTVAFFERKWKEDFF